MSEIDPNRQLPAQYLQEIFEKIMATENLTDWVCCVQKGSNKGDNYVSKLLKVHATGKCTKSNSTREIDLIFKYEHSNPEARKLVHSSVLFEKEQFFYTEIMPLFTKFIQAKADNYYTSNLSITCPKLFFSASTEDGHVLVMEDMSSLGFKMMNRQKCLDEAHCRLVLLEFAKFHAVSFALRDQNENGFRHLKTQIKEAMFGEAGMLPRRVQKNVDTIEKNVSIHLSKDTSSKFKKFTVNYFETMANLLNESMLDEMYSVVCHGDCWTNNFLFKYQSDFTFPDALCLLDFQIVRYGSPVLDIFYFLHVCTDGAFRKKHLKSLLDYYHDSLLHVIRSLGSDGLKLYPYTKFQEHIKQFCKFGLGMALVIIDVMLVGADKALDMEQVVDKLKEEESQLRKKDHSTELYQRIYEIVVELQEINAL